MAKQYSKLRDFRTSIMKSAPGRSVMRGSETGAEPASAAAAGVATRTCCAMAMGAVAAKAAPFRKQRRSNEDFLDLATVGEPHRRSYVARKAKSRANECKSK